LKAASKKRKKSRFFGFSEKNVKNVFSNYDARPPIAAGGRMRIKEQARTLTTAGTNEPTNERTNITGRNTSRQYKGD